MFKTQTKTNFKRRHLASMFKDKGLNIGVEVGTYKGEFAEVLCQKNENLVLKTIDPYRILFEEPWTVKFEEMEGMENLYSSASKRLASYKCQIIKKESLEAVRDFDYESIDFVYIDGSHEFDYVMADIIEWGKRVKKGGIISGHDYCRCYEGVVLAVNTYAKAHNIDVLKLTNDLTPSWWFTKK